MLEGHGVPQLLRNGENLAEVPLLAFVRDVHDGVGLKLRLAGRHRGKVAGGIVKAPVALLDDAHGEFFFFKEDNLGALAFFGQALLHEQVERALKLVAVIALPAHVVE